MNHHASHHRPDDPPGHGHGHSHSHGIIDPAIASTDRGMWALKWSFFGLLATALLQLVVVVMSGSMALFADMIHNFVVVVTTIDHAIAFMSDRMQTARRIPNLSM